MINGQNSKVILLLNLQAQLLTYDYFKDLQSDELMKKYNIITEVLKQIDNNYFDCLGNGSRLYNTLQKYLKQEMGKRIKKRYENIINKVFQQQNRYNQYLILKFLALLTIYIGINNKSKSIFIKHILQYPQYLQKQLQKQVNQLQNHKLQNIIETGQIVGEISKLSQQNKELAHKLEELINKNKELRTQTKQLTQESYYLWSLSNTNKQQKSNILQSLKINQVSSYHQMLTALRQKKNQLLSILTSSQYNIQKYTKDIEQFNKRIQADQIVIEDIMVDILKQKQRLLEAQSIAQQSKFANQRNVLGDLKDYQKNILQNLDKTHQDNCNISTKLIKSIDKNSNKTNSNLLKYNGELMQKCLSMEEKIKFLTQRNSVLHQNNEKLLNQNKTKQNLFQLMLNAQHKFQSKYFNIDKYQLSRPKFLSSAIKFKLQSAGSMKKSMKKKKLPYQITQIS